MRRLTLFGQHSVMHQNTETVNKYIIIIIIAVAVVVVVVIIVNIGITTPFEP